MKQITVFIDDQLIDVINILALGINDKGDRVFDIKTHSRVLSVKEISKIVIGRNPVGEILIKTDTDRDEV